MGNKQAQRRISARRAATFLAALGALVMSSGVALMVAATPANADPSPKIVVCKYVSTPGGELQGGNNPIEVSLNTLNNVVDAAWLANPTFPKSWNDAHGQSGGSTGSIAIGYTGEGLGISDCPGYEDNEPALDATASVAVTDPSCANENTPSYEPSGSHVTWEVIDSDLSPDGFVTVKFTATTGHAFDDESTTKTITEHFGPAETCGDNRRELTPQEPTFTPATCTSNASVTLPQATQELSRTAAGPSLGSSDAGGVHYAASGSLAPGGTVVVDATLIDSTTTKFADGAKTSWTYPVAAPSGCTQVSPPTQVEPQVVVSPPKTKTPKAQSTVTPTLVEAGLTGTTQDLRGQQGLALMVAGMVMLVAAGGLGLRVRGAAARS